MSNPTTEVDRDVQPTFVRLPRDLHSALKERAAREDRTMSQTIRVALRHYLAHTTAEQATA